MTVLEALTGYRRKIEEIRQIQNEAEEARENIRAHQFREEPYAEALAQVTAHLAATTYAGLEHSVAVLDALIHENRELKQQIDRLKLNRADSEDDEADDHFFGTHLREAWAALRRK